MKLEHPTVLAAVLAAVLAVHSVATVFFVADAVRDTVRKGLSA